jgi:hypothetical protein
VVHAVVRVGVCALVVACVAGCGGGARALTRAVYDKQMTAIGKSFVSDLGVLGTAKTADEAELALVKVQGELAATDKRLGAIAPPAPIKADQARLVAAMGELGRELGPVIAMLKTGDLNALGSVGSLRGLRDIDGAVRAIGKAGYAIG